MGIKRYSVLETVSSHTWRQKGKKLGCTTELCRIHMFGEGKSWMKGKDKGEWRWMSTDARHSGEEQYVPCCLPFSLHVSM